jgi:tetratricopeptide (TPR) repeat protein
MKICFGLSALLLASISCAAQNQKLSDWPSLVDKHKPQEAKSLCEQFSSSKILAEQVEAQKCLANAALCGNDQILLEGDDSGGGNLRGGYKPEAVDEALEHLNLGIQLAPQDLSIHEGRLHLLETSGRYDEMIKALEESASTYKGNDGFDAWMAYAPELADLRQYQVALEFMRVLDKHFPNSPDVIGNIGAFLNMLKRDNEALPYLKRAVELAPKDPINTWDLARAYDYTGDTALADQWYKKALALMTDRDQLKNSRCLYGEFVGKKLNDLSRACKLERENCESERQTACVTNPKAAKKP